MLQKRWDVKWIGPGRYTARRLHKGAPQTEIVEAHCSWCAKLDLLQRHGGRVDLRGSTGECADRLKGWLREPAGERESSGGRCGAG
jgi:hypothetical protein